MKKEIEVLMAVYNGEKFIREQIHSILNQTDPDVKIIIRDNASEDSTIKIVEECIHSHPDRIKLIRSAKNVGVIGNFAALMEQSKADYVMFSDADDVWKKDKIEKTFAKLKAIEKIHGSKKSILIHTDLTVVNRELQTIHESFWKYSNLNVTQKGHLLNRLLIQNVVTGCTVMVNRALLNLALPIPDHIVMHDWWLGLVASAFGSIDTVNAPTILYRQHGGNDTGAKKYGVISYLKRVLNRSQKKKISDNIQKRFRQAETLSERYKMMLSHENKDILDAFVKMESATFFKKRYLMAKYGFYKHGILRNAIEFLPLDWLWK